MKEKLLDSVTDILNNIYGGQSVCHFYKNKNDLIEVLVPYIKQGLENNEVCIWIVSEPLGIGDVKEIIKEGIKNSEKYFKDEQTSFGSKR